MYAYMGKILRVDLNGGKITEETVPQEWVRKLLGGVGIATKYLYNEVPFTERRQVRCGRKVSFDRHMGSRKLRRSVGSAS